jgi:hypothetical protein
VRSGSSVSRKNEDGLHPFDQRLLHPVGDDFIIDIYAWMITKSKDTKINDQFYVNLSSFYITIGFTMTVFMHAWEEGNSIAI